MLLNTKLTMINSIIVEDEPIFQEVLHKAIKASGLPVKVCGICNSKRDAKKLLAEHKPQLVFLDVELADGKGIDLLAELNPVEFETIFTTSHDKYAINAIKNNAADYLLKPIKEKDLKTALLKVQTRLNEKESLKQIAQVQTYLENLKTKEQQDYKLMVTTKEGVHLLKVNDIIRLESESNYSLVYLVNHKKYMVSKTLKYFEEKLLPYNFMRIHQSHLINLLHMKEIDHADNICVMSDGTKLEISKRKKKDFMDSVSGNKTTIV